MINCTFVLQIFHVEIKSNSQHAGGVCKLHFPSALQTLMTSSSVTPFPVHEYRICSPSTYLSANCGFPMLKPSPDLIGGVLQTKENNTLKNYMCYNDKMFFLGIKRNSHFINSHNCFDENF